MIMRNSEVILLQSGNVKLYSLFDIGQCLLFALSLADAAGKAWHLCHKIAVLSGVDHDLSHVL